MQRRRDHGRPGRCRLVARRQIFGPEQPHPVVDRSGKAGADPGEETDKEGPHKEPSWIPRIGIEPPGSETRKHRTDEPNGIGDHAKRATKLLEGIAVTQKRIEQQITGNEHRQEIDRPLTPDDVPDVLLRDVAFGRRIAFRNLVVVGLNSRRNVRDRRTGVGITDLGVGRSYDFVVRWENDRRVEMGANLYPAEHGFVDFRDRSWARLAIWTQSIGHCVVEVRNFPGTVSIITSEAASGIV